MILTYWQTCRLIFAFCVLAPSGGWLLVQSTVARHLWQRGLASVGLIACVLLFAVILHTTITGATLLN